MGRMGLSAMEKQHFDDAQRGWANMNNGSFDVQIITDADREQALEYISGSDRLVVIPSLNDNLPYTIMECLIKKVDFLASAVGGIPELVFPEDRGNTLFKPNIAALSEKLRARLSAPLASMPGSSITDAQPHSYDLARPSFSVAGIREDWLTLHRNIRMTAKSVHPVKHSTPIVSVAIMSYERFDLLEQAIAGVLGQDYSNIELIVLDDGSSSPDAVVRLEDIEERLLRPHGHRLHRVTNRYVGDARNAAAELMKGQYLL